MKQQTAIQWLCMKLSSKLGMPNAIGFYIDHQEEIFEAKEMEKQQIEIAFEQGMINSADYYIPQASGREIVPECENYYNETYKND
jgi:hypothetical protein